MTIFVALALSACITCDDHLRQLNFLIGEGFDVGQLDVGELTLGGVEGTESCEGSGTQRGCNGSREKNSFHIPFGYWLAIMHFDKGSFFVTFLQYAPLVF